MLVAWRRQLEANFVFDSSKGLSQQDYEAARLKFASEFHNSELTLKRAAEQLRIAYENARQQFTAADRELAITNENLGQARVDILESP